MTFHKEGYPTLVLTILFSIIILGLAYEFGNNILSYLAWAISLFFIVIVLQFFRNPSRSISEVSPKSILTPADGKVVVIEKVFEKEYLKEECWQVSVFMSPLNVHINRNPIDGEVEYLKYHPGKYLVAWHPKSSEENERYTTVYRKDDQKILIRQIAGALARRIVNYLKQDQQVNKGEEMGFIKFGSRVDVFLPIDAEIKVELDQIVKSPIDVLAELN